VDFLFLFLKIMIKTWLKHGFIRRFRIVYHDTRYQITTVELLNNWSNADVFFKTIRLSSRYNIIPMNKNKLLNYESCPQFIE